GDGGHDSAGRARGDPRRWSQPAVREPGRVVGCAVDLPCTRGGTSVNGHGGELALAALSGYGVREMFTLSGGHIFPFYDAVAKGTYDDWRILDVRHEQTATFAAEATAKLTPRPGVAVLTAGPGVT